MEYIIPAALEPWQAGTSYAKGTAFVHNGAVYFARQAVVSAEHQQPGSTGMEAAARDGAAGSRTGRAGRNRT